MKTKYGVGPGIGLLMALVCCSLSTAQQTHPKKDTTGLDGAMQDRAQQSLKNHPKMIKPPGATSSVAEGVNDSGQIVGTYDKNHRGHGFLYDNGTYQTIDYPNAIFTEALGINNNGEIVGVYWDQSGGIHGFMLINGTFSTLDFPGAKSTDLYAVNNQGWVVGNYGMPDGSAGSFLWDGASFTNITYPGSGFTAAFGLNDAGDVVGTYNTASTDGFLYHNGVYSLISLPGVQLSQKIHFIEAIGINNRGDIAGSYIDNTDEFRAFDMKGGNVTTISSIVARGFAVNNDQELVGYLFAKDATSRGFAVVAKDAANIAIGSDKNPSKVGETVMFTAVVSGGNAVATGTITFKHGTTILGSASLSNGQASFTTTFTKAGTVTVFAEYAGDENYFDGKSAKVKQVVAK